MKGYQVCRKCNHRPFHNRGLLLARHERFKVHMLQKNKSSRLIPYIYMNMYSEM